MLKLNVFRRQTYFKCKDISLKSRLMYGLVNYSLGQARLLVPYIYNRDPFSFSDLAHHVFVLQLISKPFHWEKKIQGASMNQRKLTGVKLENIYHINFLINCYFLCYLQRFKS